MKTYTKESLIEELREIRAKGWITSGRHGNVGGVGNTLEDLLGIEENNLPLPNAAEWELKCQRIDDNSRSTSLTTLFHMEPSPRAMKFVPNILLPNYGWKHQEAGSKYSENEKSFRQTLSSSRSSRGFCLQVDRKEQKVLISFDYTRVDKQHSEWFSSVKKNAGLGELSPQPYWGFKDLFHKAGTKLTNCFFVGAKVKKENRKEFFRYDQILKLSQFSLDRFINALESGSVLIDFDARTGHNHGTKFRFRQNRLPELYDEVEEL